MLCAFGAPTPEQARHTAAHQHHEAPAVCVYWARHSQHEVAAVRSDMDAVKDELLGLCRLSRPQAARLLQALADGDTDTMNHIKSKVPSDGPFLVLPALCAALQRGATLQAQSGDPGSVEMKVCNVPATVSIDQLISELQGGFGALIAATVSAKAWTGRIPAAVECSRALDSSSMALAAAAIKQPTPAMPWHMSVIQVDRVLAAKHATWYEESTSRLCHFHRVLALGELQRFMYLWVGENISLPGLYSSSTTSENATKWGAEVVRAINQRQPAGMQAKGTTLVPRSGGSSSTFVLVSWSAKLHRACLLRALRMFRFWRLPAYVACTFSSAASGATATGAAGGASAVVDEETPLTERSMLMDEMSDTLRQTFVEEVLKPIPQDLLGTRTAVDWALHALECEEDNKGGIDLSWVLKDGEAERLEAMQATAWAHLPELSPMALARLAVLTPVHDAETLPDSIAAIAAGTWGDVRRRPYDEEDDETVPVFKVPKGMSREAVVAELLAKTDSSGSGSTLWYHGTDWDYIAGVMDEIDVTSSAPTLEDGLDFGIGFYMSSTCKYAHDHVRASKCAVFVYRECRRRAGSGAATGHRQGDLWKQVVYEGVGCGSYKKKFVRALKRLGLGAPAWLEGDLLKTRHKLGRWQDATPVGGGTQQLCVRDDDHAKAWDKALVAILIIGASDDDAAAGGVRDGHVGVASDGSAAGVSAPSDDPGNAGGGSNGSAAGGAGGGAGAAAPDRG